jgi:hypothetical protein
MSSFRYMDPFRLHLLDSGTNMFIGSMARPRSRGIKPSAMTDKSLKCRASINLATRQMCYNLEQERMLFRSRPHHFAV